MSSIKKQKEIMGKFQDGEYSPFQLEEDLEELVKIAVNECKGG